MRQSVEKLFLDDGDNVLADLSGSSESCAFYVTPGLDANLSITTGGNTYYYTQDSLETVRTLTNSSAATVNKYDYTPFGSAYSPNTQTPIIQRYTYTGRETNIVSPLMYYRYRNYNTNISRFDRRDPAMEYGNPNGNFYSYVMSHPIKYRDAWGLAAEDIFECCENRQKRVISYNFGRRLFNNKRHSYPRKYRIRKNESRITAGFWVSYDLGTCHAATPRAGRSCGSIGGAAALSIATQELPFTIGPVTLGLKVSFSLGLGGAWEQGCYNVGNGGINGYLNGTVTGRARVGGVIISAGIYGHVRLQVTISPAGGFENPALKFKWTLSGRIGIYFEFFWERWDHVLYAGQSTDVGFKSLSYRF